MRVSKYSFIVVLFFCVFLPLDVISSEAIGIIYMELSGYGQSDLYYVDVNATGRKAISTDPKSNVHFHGYTADGVVIYSISDRITDGRNINQDIFAFRLSDGKSVPLAVTGQKEDVRKLLPDGRVIYDLYSGDQADLVIIGKDGSGRIVLSNSPLFDTLDVITDDGRVVFYKGKNTDGIYRQKLYSKKLDGTDEKAMNDDGGKTNNFFEGLTRDNRVLYSSYPLPRGDNGDLYIVNIEGTGKTVVANGPGEEFRVELERDDVFIYGEIVKEKDGELSYRLHAVDLKTKPFRNVEIGTEIKGSKRFSAYTKAADIIFQVDDGKGTIDLYLHEASSGREYRLTEGIGVGRFEAETADGRFIIGTDVLGTNADLYAVTKYGVRTPLARTKEFERYMAFGADERVIFIRISGGKQWDLYSIKPDGTEMATLAATDKDEYFVKFAPGNKVIFSRTVEPRQRDIYVIDADGKNLKALAASKDDELFEKISTDGKVFYVRMTAPDKEEFKKPEFLRRMQGDIYVVGLDGKGRKALASSPYPESVLYVIEK
ncbi:MAG: hypothetical protein OEV59_01460 [Deltaproteobacteria bacterium]|nr:hypothetical protein [Deltaproteobacteria bacterium]